MPKNTRFSGPYPNTPSTKVENTRNLCFVEVSLGARRTMIEHPIQNSQLEVSRAGGAVLALGTLCYAVAVVAFVILYGQPDGTGAGGAVTLEDRVSHFQTRWRLAVVLWLVEMVAALLIAIAGFVLHNRLTTSRSWLSPRLAWTTVGVGAMLLLLMYAFMLGGYPSAATVFDAEPGLFAVLNGIATFLFNVGNAVVFLGFAGAFATEATPQGVVAKGLAAFGVAVCLLSTVVAIGMLIGIGTLSAAAPLGLVVFLLTAYLGFAIWRYSERTELKSTP
jgi:hypothetical protein